MPSEGLVRNYGICKEDKCYEEPICMPEWNWLVAQQIFNEDAEGRVFINNGIMTNSSENNKEDSQ